MSKIILMHDLKPERPDLSPPLPAILMLLPVLFYLSAVGSVGFGALCLMKIKQAQADEQREIDGEQTAARMKTTILAEQKVIDDTQAKATEVESWMKSTQPLMEIVAAVVNSVKTGNTLSSLRLTRSAEKPDHVDMRMEINSGGTIQQQETVQALVKAGLQTFRDDIVSPDKNDRNGAVTYTTTLVKAANPEE